MSEKIVQLNEEVIKGEIRDLVRGSVGLQYILDIGGKKNRRMQSDLLSLSCETNDTKEAASFMSKSITQDMRYRQSLLKYAEKYGVSRADHVQSFL